MHDHYCVDCRQVWVHPDPHCSESFGYECELCFEAAWQRDRVAREMEGAVP